MLLKHYHRELLINDVCNRLYEFMYARYKSEYWAHAAAMPRTFPQDYVPWLFCSSLHIESTCSVLPTLIYSCAQSLRRLKEVTLNCDTCALNDAPHFTWKRTLYSRRWFYWWELNRLMIVAMRNFSQTISHTYTATSNLAVFSDMYVRQRYIII